MKQNTCEKMRLDKWLWCARFFKTRSLANTAIKTGKILIDQQKPKPSREISVGNQLVVNLGNYEKEVVVVALCKSRQSATIAQTLYQETNNSLEKRAKQTEVAKTKSLYDKTAPNPKARPDKYARKALNQLKRHSSS